MMNPAPDTTNLNTLRPALLRGVQALNVLAQGQRKLRRDTSAHARALLIQRRQDAQNALNTLSNHLLNRLPPSFQSDGWILTTNRRGTHVRWATHKPNVPCQGITVSSREHSLARLCGFLHTLGDFDIEHTPSSRHRVETSGLRADALWPYVFVTDVKILPGNGTLVHGRSPQEALVTGLANGALSHRSFQSLVRRQNTTANNPGTLDDSIALGVALAHHHHNLLENAWVLSAALVHALWHDKGCRHLFHLNTVERPHNTQYPHSLWLYAEEALSRLWKTRPQNAARQEHQRFLVNRSETTPLIVQTPCPHSAAWIAVAQTVLEKTDRTMWTPTSLWTVFPLSAGIKPEVLETLTTHIASRRVTSFS